MGSRSSVILPRLKTKPPPDPSGRHQNSAIAPGQGSLSELNWLSFPLAFEERLTHNFTWKLQILKHIDRALGFLIGSKFDIELFLRILLGTYKYNLCPHVIKEVKSIYGNEPPASEFFL